MNNILNFVELSFFIRVKLMVRNEKKKKYILLFPLFPILNYSSRDQRGQFIIHDAYIIILLFTIKHIYYSCYMRIKTT